MRCPSIERNGTGSLRRSADRPAPSRPRSSTAAGCGDAAGPVGGIARLAPQAASATATISTATLIAPCRPAISMPAIVPKRIAINVPASTSALPSSSSSGARRSGRIAYLSGPKNAASIPIDEEQRRAAASRCRQGPPPPRPASDRDLDQLDHADRAAPCRSVGDLRRRSPSTERTAG